MSATLAIPPVIAHGLLLVIALGIMLRIRSRIRETTLISPWWWCLIAMSATVFSELAIAWQKWADADPHSVALRYAARTALLCPTVSLIGAKRPQAAAWNFVVLSLWAMLALPSAEALLLNTGQPLEVHTFRSIFLVGLVVITLASGLPTRQWPAAILATLAQTLLLAPFILPQPPFSSATLTLAGVACLVAAAIAVKIRLSPAAASSSLDRLWLDFRDSFGLFWALRVQERLIDAAQRQQWPVTLRWSGWTTLDGQPLTSDLPPNQIRPIVTTFRGLLRRFVPNRWLQDRLQA